MAIGNRLKRALRALVRGALAVVFGAVLVITVGAITLVLNAMLEYGTLERKLFHELEAIRLGADARKTELTGRLDYICFNIDNRVLRTEFREESSRLHDSFSQSLDSCGIDGSCCSLGSDTNGVIGIVKDANIRCVATFGFDFYPRGNRSFCARPEKLRVQEKKVTPGERVIAGRRGVVTADFPSFEVWGESDE
jgi:hypothetical protein